MVQAVGLMAGWKAMEAAEEECTSCCRFWHATDLVVRDTASGKTSVDSAVMSLTSQCKCLRTKATSISQWPATPWSGQRKGGGRQAAYEPTEWPYCGMEGQSQMSSLPGYYLVLHALLEQCLLNFRSNLFGQPDSGCDATTITDLFSPRFWEGVSWNFVEWSILRLSLSKPCAVLFALQNRALGRKGAKKGEAEGWPAKGARRKKGCVKLWGLGLSFW